MEILLANPRGFCAGVDRAIGIVERALDTHGAPVYVRHEVVHNRYVVDNLRERGAIFVDELNEVPEDKLVIFSAHGVAKTVTDEAERRGLKVYDATCPLVTKVHLEVGRQGRKQHEVILVGHEGHPEVEGTMGRYGTDEGIYLVETPEDVPKLVDVVKDPDMLSYVTQTTLSMDDTQNVIAELKKHFPNIHGPKKNDICYATQNRQDAVKDLAERCDLILVVGSPNSSNSNRLRELAEKRGIPAYLIDGAEDIHRQWLDDKDKIGVTAGASAPDILVEQVIEQLKKWGATDAHESKGIEETVVFPLPKELRS